MKKRILSGLVCLLLFVSSVVPAALAEGAVALSIALPDGSDGTLAVGETLQLLATVMPPEGNGVPLVWASDNPACAAVEGNGCVTAHAGGEAHITLATADNSSVSNALTINVIVPAPPVLVGEITVAAPEGIPAVQVGGTIQMSAMVGPADADNRAVTWSVADGTGQGAIDQNGVLTGNSAGTVVVTATAKDGSGIFGSLEISVQEAAGTEPPDTPQETPAVPVASISVTGENGEVDDVFALIGGTLQLQAVIAPEDATDKHIVWSIDTPDSADQNAGTAEIDEHGLLTGLTQGNVTVRAKSLSNAAIEDTLMITVLDPTAVNALGLGTTVTGVTVTAQENATVVATEQPLQLTATVAPAEAEQTVTWSVQSGAATIDANGLLTAGDTEGAVTIRATSTVDTAVFFELTLQVTTAYQYVLVLNTNPDPTVIRSTGTLDFAGTGASTQPSRTPQAYSIVNDVQTGSSVSGYAAGDKKTIGYNSYVCIGVGAHCYVWMEEGLKAEYAAAGVLDTVAAEMITIYQGRPYEALTTLAGGEIPTKDGTNMLSILMERLTTSTGYFASENGITAIHVKASSAADYTYGDLDALAGLLAHEGQHALFQHFVCNDDAGVEQPLRWLNEGLSVAVMDWVWGGDGNGSRGWLSTISGNERICGGESLAYANYRDNTGLDYGLPYLFVRYLTDQAATRYDPLPHLAKFYQTQLGGGTAESYLNAVIGRLSLSGNRNFAEALQNFYIAAVVQSGSGVHGFSGDPVVSNRVTYPIFDGASGVAYALPGTGALVLRTKNGVFVPPQDAAENILFVPFNEEQGASVWGGGIGTPDDPYQVNQQSVLGAIAQNPSGYYSLTEDIDLSGSTVFTIDSFSGTLNGNGHRITGVSAPLIYENSGTICNLTVELDMKGQYSGYIGGVACENTGSIRNVNVTGTFDGRLTGTNPYGFPAVGALVGKNYGEIHECEAAVAMSPALPANHVYIGQIAGWNCYRIYDCISRGSINVSQSAPGNFNLYAGGLTGWLYSDNFVASLKTSYSLTALNVQVSGAGNNGKVGRLVGCEKRKNADNVVMDCYGLAGMPAAGQTESQSGQMMVLNDEDCLLTETELKTASTFSEWSTGVWSLADNSYPTFGRTQDPATLTVANVKSSYYVGEALDLKGTTVTKVNGDVTSVTPTMLYVVPTLDSVGDKTVYGVCDAVPFQFDISVTAPQVTALSVKTPARSDYLAGWVFEADGVELTATIDGRQVTIVSGFTVDKTGPLTETDTQITYTYFGQTATQVITVQAREIQRIVRTTPAAKTSYYEGEQLSLTGLTFRLTYSDGDVVNGVTAEQLGQYGLKLLWSNGGILKEIPNTKTLHALEDSGAGLYLYHGDTVPETLSGVYCAVLTLNVGNRAHLADQTVVMHTGFRATDEPEYVDSDPIEGGSEDYTVRQFNTVALPDGISVMTPNRMGYSRFTFYGKAQSAFDVSLVYEVTDNIQSVTFFVTVRLVAEPLSDACDVLEATLGGYPCTVGENTISVVLPRGKSLSALEIHALYSPGAKTLQSQWNGAKFDCSDGKTPTLTVYPQSNLDNEASGLCKVYTLHGSVATGDTLAAPENLSRTFSVVTWEPVTGADAYLVTLRRFVGDTADADTQMSCTVTDTRYDMWPAITRSGRYYVTVRALDSTAAHAMSPEVSTADDIYYCNMTPVSNIAISGPASVISRRTETYSASVSPYDAGNPAVTWSVENGTGTATITAAGILTGGNPGTVHVKALAQDGSGVSVTYAVTILEPTASRTVTVNITGITRPESALWIDGICYSAGNGITVNGSEYAVELTTTTATNAVVYSYNSLTETDPHKVYPTGMTVWLLEYANNAYTATRATGFDNLLRYSGSSIRITGNKGIRMITSLATDTKNALTGGGIHGYTLAEYGTVVAWTSQLGAESLVLSSSSAKPAFAYKKNVADPIYKQGGGLTQYTNVLVGFDIAKCSPDLTMRPYIVLRNAAGKTLTLYGGTIQRSIGYIAYQNRSAFAPRTASYQYIWDIIRGVYGNTYNSEYKG